MAGRKRTPTNILQLRGSFRKNPARGRARRDEPVPRYGIGPAPAALTEAQRAAWDEIVDICAPGVLTCSDRLVMEMAAVLLTRFRTDTEFPITGIGRLQSILSSIGLTPADRSRITVPMGKGRNPFDEF